MSEEMSFNELYPKLLCASSNDHIVKEPFTLVCSHGVCKDCIPSNAEVIECKICGSNQEIIKKESIFMKNLIETSLPGLFDGLEKRMNDEIRKYKGKLMESLRLMHFYLYSQKC